MQSEIYNNPILVIQRRTVRCPLPSTTQESPVLRVERGAGLFPFLAVLGGIFDALYAGRTFTLHGIRRYVAKPQKVTRSRASATRYCKSRNDAIHTRKREKLHESGNA